MKKKLAIFIFIVPIVIVTSLYSFERIDRSKGLIIDYSLTQCSDPWDSYVEGGDVINGIEFFAKGNDITIMYVDISQKKNPSTCEACGCDSGEIAQIKFDTREDAEKFKSLIN